MLVASGGGAASARGIHPAPRGAHWDAAAEHRLGPATGAGSLRNCQTVFPNGCTIFSSHQQGVRVPIPPHPCQHLLMCVFFIVTILVGVKWYLLVVMICIFHWLMVLRIFSCAYGPFIYLLCRFKSLAHFFKKTALPFQY